MCNKKKTCTILEGLLIEDLTTEGNAITHTPDGKILFITHCVPGDIVDVMLTKQKSNYCEGRVVTYKHFSDTRCEPKCPHFGTCGGCQWQMLPYPEQLRYKSQQVVDALTHIGGLTLPPISPILGSEKIYGYRNKLEFTFADRKWLSSEDFQTGKDGTNGLGFHLPRIYDKVLDLQTCKLMDTLNDDIRNVTRTYALTHHLSFYNEHTHEGLLRNMVIRNNSEGQYLVLVVFKEHYDEGLLQHLHTTFPQIVSLQYALNDKFNDSFEGITPQVFFGDDYLQEQLGDLTFFVHPKSFFQTNSEQVLRLYSTARTFADLHHTEVVYDLYTGTGTIACFVAQDAKKVVGIEYVEDAIVDARNNATHNGITNTEFFVGDMCAVLTDEFITSHGRPDVVITDPPRAGMHPQVVETLLRITPQRIVYISCNPSTQARDLKVLQERYDITAVQPVDMFPHTQHIENVVLLTKKSLE